jgi:hypothetical protein
MHLYERDLCVHVQHRQGVCVLDVCDGPSSPRYIASRSGPSSPRYIASRDEASREKTRRRMIFDANAECLMAVNATKALAAMR